MYEIREAKEEDRDQSVELLIRTFKDIDDFEDGWVESWQNYMNRPEYGEWNLVATHEGKIVGNLAFSRNDNNFIRGGPAQIACVWAVATDQNHRQRGVLRQIYEQAFRSMKNKDLTLSVLEPSPYLGAQIAYEKFGYEVVERRVVHTFDPAGIRPTKIPENITYRQIDDENDWRVIAEIERSMSRFGSLIYSWSGFLMGAIKSGKMHIIEQDAKPVASVFLSKEKEVAHIAYAYFISDEFLPALMEFIRQQTTGISKAFLSSNQEVYIRPYFHNVRMLETKVDGAMMMRVIDFEGLSKTIRVSEDVDESITLRLVDHYCPWNEGIYHIESQKGKLNVTRTKDESVEITLAPNDISRIIGGYLSSSIWHKLGFWQCEKSVVKKLDKIFPKDSFISHFRF